MMQVGGVVSCIGQLPCTCLSLVAHVRGWGRPERLRSARLGRAFFISLMKMEAGAVQPHILVAVAPQ